MAATQDRESDEQLEDERRAFRSLIERARGGDGLAVAELVRQYEPEIRRFVRLRLAASPLRRLLDSVDISQSVLARFFQQLTSGQIDVHEPAQLYRMLSTMARNRLVDHLRKHQAQRRGGPNQPQSQASSLFQVADPCADPSELVAQRDLVAAIRSELGEDERKLLEVRLLGFEWSEISQQFGQSADTLRKRFTRAVDRAAQRLGLLEIRDE